MSVKMKEICILSLLVMLHSSIIGAAEVDCLGYSFYCPTTNVYLACVRDEARNSTFATTDRSTPCPAGYFCDTANAVPCYAESTTVKTEEPTVTVDPALGELAGYTCASAGIYPHPTDCRRYIVCTVSATGLTYVNSQHQCDNDFVYHPDSHECKLDATPCDNMNFKCVATGRFADPLNPSNYIWCLKMNGEFIALKYSCPAGEIYDGNNACVEPIVINAMETLNLRKRSLELQSNNEADEDASVYFRGKKYSNF